MQVVIVDDGSTDASQAVAIEWGQQVSAPDFEVKIISRKQQGASAARRAGALQANGSVFAFVDSDDTLRREYSEAVMAAFEDADTELVYWRQLGHFDSSRTRSFKFPRHVSMANHVTHAVLNTLCCAVSRNLYFRSGGWDEAVSVWDDWELGIRYLSALRGNAVRINKTLTDARLHGESITGRNYLSRKGRYREALNAAERHAHQLPAPQRLELSRLIAYKTAVLAAHYHREGDRDSARQTLQRAIANLPDKRGRLILKIVFAYTRRGLRGAAIWALPLLIS